jgi:hypothetical protein
MAEEALKKRRSAMNQEVAFEITGDMKNIPTCMCENSGCPRHSNCQACVQFHKLTDHPPSCKRTWNWDAIKSGIRSKNFVAPHRERGNLH